MDWAAVLARETGRYADGERRLPAEAERREKQLVRMAMAAGGAGLALLMLGRRDEAAAWLVRAADRYRESWEDAPPGSWGRPVGALKSRLLADDREGAAGDARWTLEQAPDASASPIAGYAAALARLVLGDDVEASRLAAVLRRAEGFPDEVARALEALAAGDRAAYELAVRAVLRSFEAREEYLEDVPVADTVLVLQALADPRGLAVPLRSALLPG